MKGNGRRHAAIVILHTLQAQIAFIRDLTKATRTTQVWWRIPGGRENEKLPIKETPEKTAIREIGEETGILIDENDLFKVETINKGSHDLHVFQCPVDSLEELRPEPGKEGVEVSTFTPEYVLAHPAEFHPQHIDYLILAGFVKKPANNPIPVGTA